MEKVQWLSTLPTDFCSKIYHQVKKVATLKGDNLLSNNYKVVVHLDVKSGNTRNKKFPIKTNIPSSHIKTVFPCTPKLPYENSQKVIPIPMPSVAQPRFRQTPTKLIFSKKYFSNRILPKLKKKI